MLVELLRAEQHARPGQRHRHVEVRHARPERRLENRRVEAWVARVQNGVRALGLQ
jgi:hypothetical protein